MSSKWRKFNYAYEAYKKTNVAKLRLLACGRRNGNLFEVIVCNSTCAWPAEWGRKYCRTLRGSRYDLLPAPAFSKLKKEKGIKMPFVAQWINQNAHCTWEYFSGDCMPTLPRLLLLRYWAEVGAMFSGNSTSWIKLSSSRYFFAIFFMSLGLIFFKYPS